MPGSTGGWPSPEGAARLAAFRADETGTLPEPHEDDLVEDRSACDLKGMDITTYGEFLLMLMPDFAHGYGRGCVPPKATKAKPNTDAKVRVFQERIRKHQTLFHPDDPRHVHEPDDT